MERLRSGESSEFFRQGFFENYSLGGICLGVQGFVQRTAVLLQRLEVEVGIVSFLVSPAGKVYPRQLKGQRSTGGVVFVVVFLFVRLVVNSGPGLPFKGAAGVLVETLPAEFGAAVAHADGFGVAA